MEKTNLEKRSLTVLMLVLLAAFFVLLKPFWISIMLGVIFVTLFFPLYAWLKRRLGNRPRLAAILVTSGLFFTILLPATLATGFLIEEAYTAINSLDLKSNFNTFFSNEFYRLHIEPMISSIETRFHVNFDLVGILSQLGPAVAGHIYGFSPMVLMKTASFIAGFFIMIVAVYFLFVEGPGLLKLFFDVSPLQDEHAGRLIGQVKMTIEATVYGYLLTALCQAVLALLGFGVAGLTWATAILLGILTFFSAMIPILGSTAVWLPVVIWFFLEGRTGSGVGLLLYGTFVISAIDNVLKPIIIQGKTKVHPLLIFFSLFGGLIFFGPIGILLGPLIASLLVATMSIYRREFC